MPKKQQQEKPRRPGRPFLYGDRMETYEIGLPPHMHDACAKLGDGVLAVGVRAAIEGYFRKEKKT